MGSWAQAKLSCGQEGRAWGMEPGRGHRHDLGGVWALGGQEPSHLWGQLGSKKEFPMQEDFPPVNTVTGRG